MNRAGMIPLSGRGQIALINPGQVHSGIPVEDGRVTYRMIYLDFDLMSDLASDFAEKPGAVPEFRSSVIYDPAHYAFLQNLWQRMAGNRGRLEKESTLLEGLALLVSEYGGIGKPIARTAGGNRLVGQARELLSENLEDKITLEEAARSVGLSRYHFLRVFKNETGLSPHAFRTQKRIEAGKRLLRQGLPFVQVALMTGFLPLSKAISPINSGNMSGPLPASIWIRTPFFIFMPVMIAFRPVFRKKPFLKNHSNILQ